MKLASALVCVMAGFALSGCYRLLGNDEGERYLQRKDTVTLSAGDAPKTNMVAQTIHPWPPRVGDNRIPMHGTRAVAAIECGYLGGTKKADRQASADASKGPTVNINQGASTPAAVKNKSSC